MDTSSDNFDRRRFLKGEIGGILHTGLTNTFSQTNYGARAPKQNAEDGGSAGHPVIHL